MKAKILAILEILLVYLVLQLLGIAIRSAGVVQWELDHLGWTYTGSLLFIGLPAVVIWLTHRNWSDYGISLSNWQTNLEIGIKAYLVRLIPIVFGMGGAALLQ